MRGASTANHDMQSRYDETEVQHPQNQYSRRIVLLDEADRWVLQTLSRCVIPLVMSLSHHPSTVWVRLLVDSCTRETPSLAGDFTEVVKELLYWKLQKGCPAVFQLLLPPAWSLQCCKPRSRRFVV